MTDRLAALKCTKTSYFQYCSAALRDAEELTPLKHVTLVKLSDLTMSESFTKLVFSTPTVKSVVTLL